MTSRLLAALGIAIVAVLLLLPLDSTRVTHRRDLASVELGLPLVWVQQNQASLDARLPRTVRLESPHEHPTRASVPRLVADVALLWAIVAMLLQLIANRRRH